MRLRLRFSRSQCKTERHSVSIRYVGSLRVPRSMAPGRVLMHNHVQHSVDTPCGVNGFRAWTDTEPPSEFGKCPCGWSGLPHYAHRAASRSSSSTCRTAKCADLKQLGSRKSSFLAMQIGRRHPYLPAPGPGKPPSRPKQGEHGAGGSQGKEPPARQATATARTWL